MLLCQIRNGTRFSGSGRTVWSTDCPQRPSTSWFFQRAHTWQGSPEWKLRNLRRFGGLPVIA